jgi:hypothetical protein
MKRLRVHWRLWWQMALIAAIGLGLGAWIEVPRLRDRSQSYRRWAERYAEMEQQALREQDKQRECRDYWAALGTEREKKGETLVSSSRRDGEPDANESWVERVARTKQQAAWHAREASVWERKARSFAQQRAKCQRFANYPWLSMEPDLTEPDSSNPEP